MQDLTAIKRMEMVYSELALLLTERSRRQWAAAEAKAYGWGGIQAVRAASGMSANTIRKGLSELANWAMNTDRADFRRVRQVGGGRKAQTAWMANSGMLAESGSRRANRWRSRFTTSLTRKWARQSLMGCTT